MADGPIVGAWELVSDSRVGVSIYTDSHFSTVMAAKNRQRRHRFYCAFAIQIRITVVCAVKTKADSNHVIAAVVFIVANKHIQFFVEGNVGDIPQPRGKHVKIATIGSATKDTPFSK